jgi:hypothetical protein
MISNNSITVDLFLKIFYDLRILDNKPLLNGFGYSGAVFSTEDPNP